MVDYIKGQREKLFLDQDVGLLENQLAEDLAENLESKEGGMGSGDYVGEEDPLYEEAKKIVIETKKASASFLQRRLRIGYARAARLLDVLEEQGIVGPGEGAKPREVYGGKQDSRMVIDEEGEGDWKKV